MLTELNLKTPEDWLKSFGEGVDIDITPTLPRKKLEDKSPELHRAEMIDSYMLSIAEVGDSCILKEYAVTSGGNEFFRGQKFYIKDIHCSGILTLQEQGQTES